MIKVAIYEDNKQLRESLEVLLDNSGETFCAGAWPDYSKLIKTLKETGPDIAVMDLHVPGMNGIEALKIARKHFPQLPLLVQTMYSDDEHIFAAVCAGASGYILKGASNENIIQAIKDVYAGGSAMTPSVARRVLQMFAENEKQSAPEIISLSPREKEILALMVKGCSYKMIAAQLQISFGTVHTHTKKIYEKLHVNSNTEAVAKALKQKIV